LGGARRSLPVRLVHERQLVKVGDEDATAHDIAQRCAGFVKDRLDLAEHHCDLDLDRAVYDTAVPSRDLPRDEDEFPSTDDESGNIRVAHGGVGLQDTHQCWTRLLWVVVAHEPQSEGPLS
jgi:hypothetical protein